MLISRVDHVICGTPQHGNPGYFSFKGGRVALRKPDEMQPRGGRTAPDLPEARFWSFELRRPSDTAGTEPRLQALWVAAKMRFRMHD